MTDIRYPESGEENWLNGNVSTTVSGPPLPNGTATFDNLFSPKPSRQYNEYEKGWLISSTTAFGVHEVTNSPLPASVLIRTLITPGSTGDFALLDDDNTGVPPSHWPILPIPSVDHSFLAGKFRPAFIELMSTDIYNPRKTIPFNLNEAPGSILFLPVIWNNAIDIEDREDQWTAHLVFGYQPSDGEDSDPNSEDSYGVPRQRI